MSDDAILVEEVSGVDIKTNKVSAAERVFKPLGIDNFKWLGHAISFTVSFHFTVSALLSNRLLECKGTKFGLTDVTLEENVLTLAFEWDKRMQGEIGKFLTQQAVFCPKLAISIDGMLSVIGFGFDPPTPTT